MKGENILFLVFLLLWLTLIAWLACLVGSGGARDGRMGLVGDITMTCFILLLIIIIMCRCLCDCAICCDGSREEEDYYYETVV